MALVSVPFVLDVARSPQMDGSIALSVRGFPMAAYVLRKLHLDSPLAGTLVTISIADMFPVTLFPLITMFSVVLIRMSHRQSRHFVDGLNAVNDLALAEAERLRLSEAAARDVLAANGAAAKAQAEHAAVGGRRSGREFPAIGGAGRRVARRGDA